MPAGMPVLIKKIKKKQPTLNQKFTTIQDYC